MGDQERKEVMTSELITNEVWTQISRAARRCNSPSHVAVAFIGSGASRMLPLKKGSRLVVDASRRTVKAGLTSPFELEKFYRRGVRIYSCNGLHAKVFVFGAVAFVGSANVSKSSRDVLTEAILRSDARNVVSDAEAFVRQIGLVEMGKDEIAALQKIYVAPKNGGRKQSGRLRSSNLRIVHLDEPEDVPDEAAESVRRGEQRARKLVKSRHRSDYVWNDFGLKYRNGERLLFIQGDYMWPPATVLFGQSVKGIIVTHIEMSTQRDKSVKSVKARLTKKTYKRLSRQGVVSEAASRELLKLWD